MALVGVVLLLIPQITLTVVYMVDLFAAGERLDELALTKGALEDLDAAVRPLISEPLLAVPRGSTPEDTPVAAADEGWKLAHAAIAKLDGLSVATKHLPLLAAVRRSVQALELAVDAERHRIRHQEPLDSAVVTELLATGSELDLGALQWRLDTPEPTVEQALDRLDTLERRVIQLRLGLLGASALDMWQLARRFERVDDGRVRLGGAQSRLLASIHALRSALSKEVAEAGRSIRAEVDAANRYLITLVLLTLVYLALVILLLPTRLVAPLGHLESVMQAAGQGRLDVQARVVGDDEMGRVSTAFNRMMDQLAAIDDAKRDRIYEDRQRIDLLAGRLDTPLAVLDTRARIEHANRPFVKLFELAVGYHGTQLTSVLGGADADRFSDALDRVMRGRQPGPIRIALQRNDDVVDYDVSVQPGRGRNGRVAFVVASFAVAEKERSTSGP